MPDTLTRRRATRLTTLVVLVVLLFTAVGVNLVLGQFTLSPAEVWSALTHGPGLGDTESTGEAARAANVLWQIRLPRIMLCLLVGAALAVAGTLLQGLFGNPLAEPSVIGVTSGAGVGAAAAIVLNITVLGTATVPVLAFLAGVLTTVAVYRLASINGEVRVLTLILTGIAVNAVAGAAISFLVFLAPTSSREQVIFWQMGSLNGAQWNQVAIVALPVVLCLLGSVAIAGRLDVLSLGERAAGHAGVNVAVMRVAIIGLSTALAALAVSFAGIIGFVGLIVPHILRQLTGPANRWLVPLSALGGAVLLLLADLASRTLIAFADLPIGIFTALVGGPTFFILLRRMLKKGGVVG
ncbi:FecCD family ABC transporter permease [Corynebacterium glyciniphilum]|uniref:ABC-type iron transporter, permease subunit n=1 Tax=Corynebacterium glyciniphilum AJ 3170 TaxID=1404245 RepID=X5DT20_9CORY|nr:iron ABC transporter permease [Corynebacterium glyciniphilum]AHW64454.1 ABC-type iron transporter, permease subunit [Corynebacterium glyciniphilum AJ 3170]